MELGIRVVSDFMHHLRRAEKKKDINTKPKPPKQKQKQTQMMQQTR